VTGALRRDREVVYCIKPPETNEALNSLFDAAWSQHAWRDFQPVLSRSLTYVCAYQGDRLIGFVNLAWDGGIHAFVLDTTVHPEMRRQWIGQQLVRHAVMVAQERGVEWVHVDFGPHLQSFYQQCRFRWTAAGLLHVAVAHHTLPAPARGAHDICAHEGPGVERPEDQRVAEEP
jgi:GNAT superfamily N-acetyltransferase